MEIRNALQKIENYLTVVSNLNKTILSEGAMSREELLLMKKYLNSCIERISDIERKLSLNTTPETKHQETSLVTNTTEIISTPQPKEIVEVEENLNIDDVEAALDATQKEELEVAMEEIEHAEIKAETLEVVQNTVETPEVIAAIKTDEIIQPENKIEETIQQETPVLSTIQKEHDVKNEINTTVNTELETDTKIEETPSVATHLFNSVTQTISELKEKAEEIKNSEFVQKAENHFDNFVAVADQKIEAITEHLKEKEDVDVKEEDSLVAKLEEQKKTETSFFEKLESKFKDDNSKPLFHLFDDGKEDFHETLLNKEQDHNKVSFPEKKHEEVISNTTFVKDEVEETKIEPLNNNTSSSLNDIFKTTSSAHVETIQQPKVRKSLAELIMLNDKFVFVRELFGNQFAEYDTAIKTLEGMHNLNDAENYCRVQLWTKFNWNEKVAYQMRFFDILQKRFD